MRKPPRNLAAKKVAGPALRTLSLPVAILAINLGPLVSPVQEKKENK
jgi:hypothetical protein